LGANGIMVAIKEFTTKMQLN